MDTYRLWLDAPGDKVIAVIKEVRAFSGLGLKEAKELVDRSRAGRTAIPVNVLAGEDEMRRYSDAFYRLTGAGAFAHLEQVLTDEQLFERVEQAANETRQWLAEQAIVYGEYDGPAEVLEMVGGVKYVLLWPDEPRASPAHKADKRRRSAGAWINELVRDATDAKRVNLKITIEVNPNEDT